MAGKPILVLDFDGVLHSYTSGWRGEANIPDPIVPGAIEFMLEAAEHFALAVVSSRGRSYDGKKAMRNYLTENLARYYLAKGLSATTDNAWNEAREWLGTNVDWPDEKPPAKVTIDDRALTFCGKWPTIQELLDFEPWTKRKPVDPVDVPFTATVDGGKRYVRRHSEIEAVQWLGGKQHHPGVSEQNGMYLLYVFNSQAHCVLEVGDWIVTEPTPVGAYYPVKDDIFRKRYEPAEPQL